MQGRPSLYTNEIADEICERIANGETLKQICEDSKYPDRSTIFRWLEKSEYFQDVYARARKHQIQSYVDDIIYTAQNVDASSHESISATRLQIDTKKWFVTKLVPRYPALSGAYHEQARQIIDALRSGDINTEAANALMDLITKQATFVPLDQFERELHNLNLQLTSLKNKLKNNTKNIDKKEVV